MTRVLFQHPRVLHLTAARDVDELAAGSGYPSHSAGDGLDGLGVGGEGVYAIVCVRVAQDELSVFGLAQDVGRELERALGDVLDGVLFDLFAELLDLLLRLLRGYEDALAAPAAAALYDELVEVVHDVAFVVFNGQREGHGVLEDRLFTEVGPDHVQDKGIDAFVVGYAEVGSEDGLYLPRRLRLDEPG